MSMLRQKMQLFSMGFCLLLCAVLLGRASSTGQSPAPRTEVAARQVVNKVCELLEANYVFPEKAKLMATALRERTQRKEYDEMTDGAALAALLTTQLRELVPDRHLRVNYSRQPLAPFDNSAQLTPEQRAERRRQASQINFGFARVEWLPGNLGYLDLRLFADAEAARETLAAAMGFLANTRALIIDLRENGGGQPEMVALLSGYFFPEPVHLNDIYWRPDNSTYQLKTSAVAGQRYLNKEVYVLTSQTTFSAAEAFAYNLQAYKRAIVVGETSGGGAHTVLRQPIDEHFWLAVPAGLTKNPITNTNWEGVGVIPDVKTPAAQALTTAQLLALKAALAKTADAQSAANLRRLIGRLEQSTETNK